MDVLQEKKLIAAALEESPEEPRTELVQRRRRVSYATMEAADALHGFTLPRELQFLRRLESGTAAALLGGLESIGAFAEIHLEEGRIYALREEPALAETKLWRALELYLEALSRATDEQAASPLIDAVYALSAELDPALLPEPYYQQLRRLKAH